MAMSGTSDADYALEACYANPCFNSLVMTQETDAKSSLIDSSRLSTNDDITVAMESKAGCIEQLDHTSYCLSGSCSTSVISKATSEIDPPGNL